MKESVLEILTIQNPWWRDPASIRDDLHLRAIVGKPYRYDPPILHTLSFLPGDISILRGPRQVGKTTLIKLLIERLLREGVAPEKILYLSCESFADFRSLESLLIHWLQQHPEGVRLFLDEISFVPDWQRALLALSNMGLLEQASVLLTGSNARDLKESGERLPGRRGKGIDLSLYPLSPRELGRLPCFESTAAEDLLEIYLKVGGFPRAIKDYVEKGSVTDTTYETYRNWIIGDAHRYELRQETLRDILFRIAETAGTRVTWPALIKNSPVKSHETALQYVEHLQDAFLCQIIHCYDPNRDGAAPQKARKIYFVDPILQAIGAAWKLGITNIYPWFSEKIRDPSMRGYLFESLVINSFARSRERIYFWYSTKDQTEIDLVLPSAGDLRLYEIKLQAGKPWRALNHAVEIIDPTIFLESREVAT